MVFLLGPRNKKCTHRWKHQDCSVHWERRCSRESWSHDVHNALISVSQETLKCLWPGLANSWFGHRGALLAGHAGKHPERVSLSALQLVQIFVSHCSWSLLVQVPDANTKPTMGRHLSTFRRRWEPVPWRDLSSCSPGASCSQKVLRNMRQDCSVIAPRWKKSSRQRSEWIPCGLKNALNTHLFKTWSYWA